MERIHYHSYLRTAQQAFVHLRPKVLKVRGHHVHVRILAVRRYGDRRHNAGSGMCISLVGYTLFILMPTIMDRVSEGVLQKVQEPGVLNWMMKFIYAADGWEKGRALFPSFHCLMSIYCYLGIRKQNEISRGFKVYTVVMTILICLSTLYTKQHYIVDVIGGLGIPVICYAIVRKLDPAGSIMKEKL